MEQTSELVLPTIFVIFIVFFGSMILFSFTKWLIKFRRELKLLKSEIGRTFGRERKYWMRKRRRLWFSLLPFVRY